MNNQEIEKREILENKGQKCRMPEKHLLFWHAEKPGKCIIQF